MSMGSQVGNTNQPRLVQRNLYRERASWQYALDLVPEDVVVAAALDL